MFLRVVVFNLRQMYLIFHSVIYEMARQWAFTRVIESTQNDLHKIHILRGVDGEPRACGSNKFWCKACAAEIIFAASLQSKTTFP